MSLATYTAKTWTDYADSPDLCAENVQYIDTGVASVTAEVLALEAALPSTYQPISAELSALAGLSSTGYAKRTGAKAWSVVSAIPQADVSGLTAALAGLQPLDSDLTAIAALSTQAFGRSLLTVANAAAARTAIGAQAAGSYQPLDADLTAISALATTGFVRRIAADTWAASALVWGDIASGHPSVIAGTGLTGGGSLTGSVTMTVSYGTTASTAAQGNDSRILNGQTAFGWGNHASAGYALSSAIPLASSTTPAALGTAAVGTGTTWARADHVHAMPTAAQVGALSVGAQAADSAKLGGQLPSYYATASSLESYLPRAGGTISGPLVINAAISGSGNLTRNIGSITSVLNGANILGADVSSGTGWNSMELKRGMDGNAVNRRMTYSYNFPDKGMLMRVEATQSYANDQTWKLLSCGGTRSGDGWTAEAQLLSVSGSCANFSVPLSGMGATFTLPASSAGTVLAGQSGAAYSAMGSWLGAPGSHAWFGKSGYNSAAWSGLLTDGNQTWVGANTGCDVRICVQNDIAIFSDEQVTLNRGLVGTTGSFSGAGCGKWIGGDNWRWFGSTAGSRNYSVWSGFMQRDDGAIAIGSISGTTIRIAVGTSDKLTIDALKITASVKITGTTAEFTSVDTSSVANSAGNLSVGNDRYTTTITGLYGVVNGVTSSALQVYSSNVVLATSTGISLNKPTNINSGFSLRSRTITGPSGAFTLNPSLHDLFLIYRAPGDAFSVTLSNGSFGGQVIFIKLIASSALASQQIYMIGNIVNTSSIITLAAGCYSETFILTWDANNLLWY